MHVELSHTILTKNSIPKPNYSNIKVEGMEMTQSDGKCQFWKATEVPWSSVYDHPVSSSTTPALHSQWLP